MYVLSKVFYLQSEREAELDSLSHRAASSHGWEPFMEAGGNGAPTLQQQALDVTQPT